MDELQRLLSNQWTSAIESSCANLERNDLRQVSNINSWSDLENQVQASKIQEMMLLWPSLKLLIAFTDQWIVSSVSSIDMAMFVGIVRLAAKLIENEDAAVRRVPRLLRELCHKIDLCGRLCAKASQPSPQHQQACIETGLATLGFCTYIIQFMRSNVNFVSTGNRIENEWKPVADAFDRAMHTIDGAISQIETLQKLKEPVRKAIESEDHLKTLPIIARPSSPLFEEYAKLPCIILPSNRTTRFFDRTDLIQKMENYFSEADSEGAFRSLALHGLGGVGKSSIALRYAETKFRKKELNALFWVHSEKVVSIQQSFTDIAMRLKLPGARAADHEENHILVLEWLQSTTCRWLIVYDNAEDIELLLPYWPPASRGQAIITTRNHAFAFDLAESGLEVLAWDDTTGSQFLLHLLSTDISGELEEETVSALELSKKLSGHALAISHMAGLIHKRAWSIAEFMRIYTEHGTEMHGFSGNKSINAIWDISFRSLNAPSSTVLGILCFLEPDNVPQELFEPNSSEPLPETLFFCNDQLRFSEAIEALLTLALIKRDRNTRTFSVHRLVQASFLRFMSSAHKQQRFNDASTLVSIAFPRRTAELAELYIMWPRCAIYLQHVLSLKDHFRIQKRDNPSFKALTTYCELNNSCQRYLLEIDNHAALEDLIEVSFMAMATIPVEEKTIVMEGEIASHTGQMYCRLGRLTKGIEWLRKSYATFSSEVPFNATESGWAANNLATGLATANTYSEAIEWYEHARDHWLEYTSKDPTTQGQWPPTIKTSTGRAHFWAGYPQRGQELLQQAVRELKSMKTYQWAGFAEAYFALGNLSRQNHDYETAESYFMEAQNAWLKGDQLRSAPFNGSCMYKIGCNALDQGKSESAIKHLRDALAVTKMRGSTFVGEHARVMFKLSEALEQEPGEELEAQKLRSEAERLLRQRMPNMTRPGIEATYNDLVSILWR